MAVSSISRPGKTVSGSTGNIYYSRVGYVVVVEVSGAVTLSGDTMATLPEDYRPDRTLYFMVSGGGSVTKVPYLVAINDSGVMSVYRRGDTVSYAYGTVSYIVSD